MLRDRDQIIKDLQVYLVMGLEGYAHLTALQLAREAIAGGVTMVQLREKNAPLKQVLAQGAQLRELCRELNVPFLVNDRVDVAILLNADGVHVGQDDIPGVEARRLLGDDKIIGISAGTMEEAEWAMENGADYLGVGPVYSTATKQDAGEAIGTQLIAAVAQRWDIPVVGIGGINSENAAVIVEAGAHGVAVVSAITKQQNPFLAAQTLVSSLQKALLK
ncbi:thiamine phosphate synthase [Paenibacillus radicis (ex Xue et al. 2023)]|uniref:Thiamine-phosphate synthase n=1 Tax=Paenibacillus radicis (ex Xue et al. 2023) TaxID=2972489 RepID=A0ABT1YK72_9BACL|nr:thiamine phosphate synthase [Paenibacillus radicis (ex Xue et al. 2023)]MCR8633576.1 thiamine phosphate synthase [Paenibacillus radicis (ex Xue et al. 2023)]